MTVDITFEEQSNTFNPQLEESNQAFNLDYGELQVMRGKDGKDGVDGKDGYTPIKGTDYWTDADKAEIVAEVLANFVDVSEVGR